MSAKEMTLEEIERFLACARVGRIGIQHDARPCIIPVGFVFADGKIAFHTCSKGCKVEAIRQDPHVCFEVDEALSDASMYKSVIVFGTARILDRNEEMIPYLQKLLDKYRISRSFDDYMNRPGKNRKQELAAVRICLITPTTVTGRKFESKSGATT